MPQSKAEPTTPKSPIYKNGFNVNRFDKVFYNKTQK
jgi:hypothetical protein